MALTVDYIPKACHPVPPHAPCPSACLPPYRSFSPLTLSDPVLLEMEMWLLLLLLLFFSSAVSPTETLVLLVWHACVLWAWRVVLLLEWTIHELNV